VGRGRLLIFAGLPGVGKTTLAQRISRAHSAFLIRIDAIEIAFRRGEGGDVGACGYEAASELARLNLKLEHDVIIDCVNPVSDSRAMFEALDCARRLRVELSCADTVEHRRRIEARQANSAHPFQPGWADVLARGCAPWTEADLHIDTGRCAPDEAAELIGQAW